MLAPRSSFALHDLTAMMTAQSHEMKILILTLWLCDQKTAQFLSCNIFKKIYLYLVDIKQLESRINHREKIIQHCNYLENL